MCLFRHILETWQEQLKVRAGELKEGEKLSNQINASRQSRCTEEEKEGTNTGYQRKSSI
ncbi:hypothetical protein DY000_02058670 [Brassica cretica]|uniref:Uncharacterized protein n=1 Tax=Brassica cretica TaxID=69181 RepID=A0ABQ7AUB2_BRACR|nr:hypothetical protein DY000_02058670 [Brassica cretica]